MNEDLNPIKDVIIEIQEYSNLIQKVSTNGDGDFQFELVNIKGPNTKTNFTLYCRHRDYPAQYIKEVRIDETGLITRQLILGPSPPPPPNDRINKITGKLIDEENDKPISGVILELSDYLNQVENAITNENGIFEFDVTKTEGITTKSILRISSYKAGSCPLLTFTARIDETGLIIYPFPISIICNSHDPPEDSCFNYKKYLEDHKLITIGILGGIGYRGNHQVTFSNVPREIRTGRPHPDDLMYRPNDILDPNIPDSYLIEANQVNIDLSDRFSFDLLNISFKGLVYIAFRTSPIWNESEKIEFVNLHRKKYTTSGGDAFIYYCIQSKKDRLNLSIPVYGTFPVFCFPKGGENIFRIVAGTNILSPTIQFEGEKGWDRFGQKEPYEIVDVGKLKETEWFVGFDIERPKIQFGFQLALVHTKFKSPLSISYQDEFWPSYWFKFAFLF